MTIDPRKPSASGPRPSLPVEEGGANLTIRAAAVTAGVALLLMSVLAGFAKFVAVDGAVTPGDAERTAADIAASEGLFRFGILCLFLVIVLDVVVAWGLYRVFRPVSESLSLLAAAFRLVYAGVFMVAIARLLDVLRLLGDGDHVPVSGADQAHAQVLLGITAFDDLWNVALILFAAHLFALGYLSYRSGYVPRFLGVLLAIAGAGYLIDSVGVVLSPGAWPSIGSYTFIGEFLLALWLVIRGPRLTPRRPAPQPDPIPSTRG
ncbi:DUF4386 domain-containing protein [Amycolatopsis sp. NPDC051128]|uniref:DUF4386 domain-containing protein n=1 Tax=Amycolatopsis sp. NPDC051128 TaxID=3155412 RepID=UPI00341A1DD2